MRLRPASSQNLQLPRTAYHKTGRDARPDAFFPRLNRVKNEFSNYDAAPTGVSSEDKNRNGRRAVRENRRPSAGTKGESASVPLRGSLTQQPWEGTSRKSGRGKFRFVNSTAGCGGGAHFADFPDLSCYEESAADVPYPVLLLFD